MDDTRFLPRQALQTLLDALHRQGYRTLGPVVQDAVVQYLDIDSIDRLPSGWTDDQAPGRYRLSRVDSPRCFAWATGAQALKPHLFHAREVLWNTRRDDAGKLVFGEQEPDVRRLAVIGVRACDLAALELQDRHFLHAIKDPYYAAKRQGLFVVAVHCAYSADTCFCASTGDGPRATHGFDLALSELDDGYLVETGSDRGRAIATQLPLQSATSTQVHEAAAAITEAANRQFRQLPSTHLRDVLFDRLQHPRWEEVAARCLACGNCTSVCPTCFCHAEHDDAALGGSTSRHLREWDSCFSEGHAYLHGFNVRPDTHQRYRQWMTHKLGSWHDQYGRSGCVGCGRCITWCPVGIDITEEANAICTADVPQGESP
ncbi:MAG: 4Fe-4S dicluster domain-containing protein [Chromatiales bacterium]|nr:4Fe-4S dicluster domain-containing protein [Chromatiales bacterium]